ncbi:hypothetical protein MBLNU457_6641t2 [Dothideomycetes sp. NU457]
MPGILPMKVIKVGTSAQARIAQACDSDKLSRRAFPRGYTESLEERVRSLETEVRELKALLDEKDEKIDMITKLQPQGASQSHLPSPRRSSASSSPSDPASPTETREDVFKVQQSPYLSKDGDADSYFSGTSSGKFLINSFKQKVHEKGRSTTEVVSTQLLSTARPQSNKSISSTPTKWHAPRLLSDQLVNIFFQEWAPLFPVLHRPTFLAVYEEYTSDPEAMTDNVKIAQLNLVFALAALSQDSQPPVELPSIDNQWQVALAAIQTEQSMSTLQCLVLAQISCIQRGGYNQLMAYKALAVSLSCRLGLHQSQKRFALGTLTCETRKKVFWSLYTVDCFSAVLLGLPRQIKDEDVYCELPVDADDEYVTERGFQPLLPGESTRLSSALALFRASRILAKVLEEVYPAQTSYELSLQKLSALAEELDQWQASLAPHLKLPFAQDKPSVGTVSSRSPLLSLTYHFIRSLIHRPAVCASLGQRSASSQIAMASSCKSIVQILQLLTERGLTFSFCLNKEELLVLSGLGLLFQGLDLDDGSKVLQDNQKMLAVVIGQLNHITAPAASPFRRIACSFLPASALRGSTKSATPSRHNSDGAMPAPHVSSIPPALKQQFKAMTSKFSSSVSRSDLFNNHRRATEPTITPYRSSVPAQSLPNLSPLSTMQAPQSEPSRSPHSTFMQPPKASPSTRSPPMPQHSAQKSSRPQNRRLTNLDYLSFSAESTPPPPPSTSHPVSAVIKSEPTDWERLLGSLDNGQTNIFDNIYGGPPAEALKDSPGHQHQHQQRTDLYSISPEQHSASYESLPMLPMHDTASYDWSHSDVWTLGVGDLGHPAPLSAPTVSESVVSFGTDEMGNGIDVLGNEDEMDRSAGSSCLNSVGMEGLLCDMYMLDRMDGMCDC